MIEKIIGYVAVDSGQIMITDPCYIKSEWRESEPEVDFMDERFKGQFSYPGACNASLSENKAGQLKFEPGHAGAGVAVSSGIGDGTYPVYATYADLADWGRRIVSVRVDFTDHVLLKDEKAYE